MTEKLKWKLMKHKWNKQLLSLSINQMFPKWIYLKFILSSTQVPKPQVDMFRPFCAATNQPIIAAITGKYPLDLTN